MIVKIDEGGTLVVEAMTETESYALLNWYHGMFTQKGDARKEQTTDIQIVWLSRNDE